MYRLVVTVVLVLVVAVSGLASVAAQDASPTANSPVSLAGTQPLSLTGARLAEFEAYIDTMLAKTGVRGRGAPSSRTATWFTGGASASAPSATTRRLRPTR